LSDNISVLHFHKLQFGSPREKRIAVYLSQFNLDIKFIRGVHNLAADSLSRAFESMTEEEKEIFRPQTTKEVLFFNVKRRQLNRRDQLIESYQLTAVINQRLAR